MSNYVEIDMDVYIDLLEQRRKDVEKWWSWTIPDCIWDYAITFIEECGVSREYSAPSYIVDNLAVNTDWAYFDELRATDERYSGLSDDELTEKAEESDGVVFKDEEIVMWRLGI